MPSPPALPPHKNIAPDFYVAAERSEAKRRNLALYLSIQNQPSGHMGVEKCSLGPLGGRVGPPGPMGAYSRKSLFFIPGLYESDTPGRGTSNTIVIPLRVLILRDSWKWAFLPPRAPGACVW